MINMAGNKPKISKPPKATGGRGNIPDVEQRAVRVMLNRSKDRTDVPEPQFKVCDPQASDEGEKMEGYVQNVVEVEFLIQAGLAEMENVQYMGIVGESDKSKQNPINHLGGHEGAGDQAMQLYLDEVQEAVKRVAGINGSRNLSGFVVRVSGSSDEGIFTIGGITLPESPQVQFREAMEMVYKEAKLGEYAYTVTIGDQTFNLNLEAFSRVLRHPNLVKACDFKISDPIPISSSNGRGFLLEEIRKLGNESIWFREDLPACMTINGGLPEVDTPFKTNLLAQNTTRTMSGTFIEVKFIIPKEARGTLLDLTRDIHVGDELVKRGTRKGFSEIYSGRLGMRGMNTFVGKPVANGWMTPIAQAMGDLVSEGIKIAPISGSHLQYWVDLPAGAETAERVRKAVEGRVNSGRTTKDHRYMDLALKPNIAWIDATQADLSEVRARFIIDSTGGEMEYYPVRILDYTDFVLNFVEYVNTNIQREILDLLARRENGSMPVTPRDLRNMSRIRAICSSHKFVRDTEDLVWTLRRAANEDLPDNIGKSEQERRELENWLFDFAFARYERIRLLLTRRIEKEMKRIGF
jgi:hypothetical protein